MKHKTFYLVGILILCIGAFVGFFMWSKNHAEAPAVNSDTNSQVNNQSSNLVTIPPIMIAVDHDSYLTSVAGSIPQFSQTSDEFNKKISDAISADIDNFNKNASVNYDDNLKIYGSEFQETFVYGDGSPYYYFNVKPTVVQSNENYVSVVVREELYAGGAHPAHNIVSYNYDVKNNEELAVTDFSSLQDLSNQARDILTKKFLNDANETVLDDNLKQMLYDGTDVSRLENFNTFTFTPTDLTIYFGEYQVAPYVFGEQEVTIPRR